MADRSLYCTRISNRLPIVASLYWPRCSSRVDEIFETAALKEWLLIIVESLTSFKKFLKTRFSSPERMHVWHIGRPVFPGG